MIKVSQKKDKEKEKEKEAKVKEREAQEEHQAEAAADAAANKTDAPKHLSGYWGHKSTPVPAGQSLAANVLEVTVGSLCMLPSAMPCAQAVMSSVMKLSTPTGSWREAAGSWMEAG